jgi:hypothetical protein
LKLPRSGAAIAAALTMFAATRGMADVATYSALRGIGWEGVWARDCSEPNAPPTGSDAKLSPFRYHNNLPIFGPPTRTAEWWTKDGMHHTMISTIVTAKLSSDKILMTQSSIENEDFSLRIEAEGSIAGNKMIVTRSHTVGTALRDIPANVFSVKPLKTGDHFDYMSAENGIALRYDGTPAGSAELERCADKD